MRKLFVLCKRNFKEIVREPISLIFCFGFPIVMLVLLQALFANLPFTPENFRVERYAVGICIFGYAFISLFTAMLFSGDKNSEFINRLHMAPISKTTFLLSYVLSMLPIALFQTLLFFACALIFKLPFSVNILLASSIYSRRRSFISPSVYFAACSPKTKNRQGLSGRLSFLVPPCSAVYLCLLRAWARFLRLCSFCLLRIPSISRQACSAAICFAFSRTYFGLSGICCSFGRLFSFCTNKRNKRLTFPF